METMQLDVCTLCVVSFQIRECGIDLILLKVFVGILDHENILHNMMKHDNLQIYSSSKC